jgi:hypothetical protein
MYDENAHHLKQEVSHLWLETIFKINLILLQGYLMLTLLISFRIFLQDAGYNNLLKI